MILLFFAFSLIILATLNLYTLANAQSSQVTSSTNEPTLSDTGLRVEKIIGGLKFPTGMAFLGPDEILVTEKNTGTVQRVINGVLAKEPLIDLDVANQIERGLLGIAIEKNRNGPTFVFLYYTELLGKDGDDFREMPLGNRLYRYELSENLSRLVKPKLLLDLPANPSRIHNGGAIAIAPDNSLYVVIGDTGTHRNLAQNNKSGIQVDGTSGILRISSDGNPVAPSVLGKKYPLNLYYAYGIRNSFGISFDPLTGKLWDTENGDWYGDEINLVNPGFNSGWSAVQGKTSEIHNYNRTFNLNDLVEFGGKGKYSDPEFSWNASVGVTSIEFLNSWKLGEQYLNNMFVGDFHNGYLYRFDLNSDRTSLLLNGPLADKFANNHDELKQVIFGRNFGAITDVKAGPDGNLYVLSLNQGGPNCSDRYPDILCVKYSSEVMGSLYRIVPR